jgi:alpha/beta hydrolase fold
MSPLPSQEQHVPHWTDIDWGPSISNRLINDLRLRYLDCGSGPALVLLHGMAASWQWWLENIPTLAQHHRVIAVDLPGFGQSEPLAMTSWPTTPRTSRSVRLFSLCPWARTTPLIKSSPGDLRRCAMASSGTRRLRRAIPGFHPASFTEPPLPTARRHADSNPRLACSQAPPNMLPKHRNPRPQRALGHHNTPQSKGVLHRSLETAT